MLCSKFAKHRLSAGRRPDSLLGLTALTQTPERDHGGRDGKREKEGQEGEGRGTKRKEREGEGRGKGGEREGRVASKLKCWLRPCLLMAGDDGEVYDKKPQHYAEDNGRSSI